MQLFGTCRIRTTAYHPGLVERFHRQLKSSLKCLSDSNTWVKALLLILLGLRTTHKQDIHCTCAKLVYGTTLHLPGQLFNDTHHTDSIDTSTYATQLKTVMQNLRPPPVRQQKQLQTHVSDNLISCPFVFVRHDGVKRALQPPYDGPYKVWKCSDKHYTLDFGGRHKVVALDRLKPAYFDVTPSSDTSPISPTLLRAPANSSSTPTKSSSPQQLRTRSGRHVHFPKRLTDYKLFS